MPRAVPALNTLARKIFGAMGLRPLGRATVSSPLPWSERGLKVAALATIGLNVYLLSA